MSQIDTLKNLVKLSNKYDNNGQFLKANLIDEQIKEIQDKIITSSRKQIIEEILSMPELEKKIIAQKSRKWLKNRTWSNMESKNFDEMSETEILNGVDIHFDGGLREFLNK